MSSRIPDIANEAIRLAVDAAMEATLAEREDRTHAYGDELRRLAVGASLAVGEIAYELSTLTAPDPEAPAAIAGLAECFTAIASAVREVGIETAAADALDRFAKQLREM